MTAASKELEVKEQAGALAEVDEATEALMAQQDAEFDSDLFSTPILKIAQPLTREVQSGDAEIGEFVNTLTGEGIGDKIGFIVAYYNKGRFHVTKAGRAYVAFGDTIPSQWEDLVGEEFVGSLFSEYPDAEEQYKARVNRKEIEWDSGPMISTTHNFTGLAIVPGVGDEPDEYQPVRLSLQRSNMPAVRKIITIKRAILRGKPFWDVVFDFGTEKKDFAQGSAHLLTVKQGRPSTADERAEAAALAQATADGRTVSNEEGAADTPVEPKANGGLEV